MGCADLELRAATRMILAGTRRRNQALPPHHGQAAGTRSPGYPFQQWPRLATGAGWEHPSSGQTECLRPRGVRSGSRPCQVRLGTRGLVGIRDAVHRPTPIASSAVASGLRGPLAPVSRLGSPRPSGVGRSGGGGGGSVFGQRSGPPGGGGGRFRAPSPSPRRSGGPAGAGGPSTPASRAGVNGR